MEEEIAKNILDNLNITHSSLLINFLKKLIEKDIKNYNELELNKKIAKYNDELENLDPTIQNTNIQQKESSKKSSNKMDLESFQTSDDGKINLNSFHSLQEQSEIINEKIDENVINDCYKNLEGVNIDSFIGKLIELYKSKNKK